VLHAEISFAGKLSLDELLLPVGIVEAAVFWLFPQDVDPLFLPHYRDK